MLKYDRFVNRFETRLGRDLYPREKDFVSWVWQKYRTEEKIKR
ncbi:hypothetical protein TMU01_15530 [Tenuibacillus multivorans]|nr:hypothetical protein TMU01_15530 [Tenuibacillus multivorans]